MADIEDVFKNKNGTKITKIIGDDDEPVLVESFINSNNELEYNVYKKDDGGVIELVPEDDVDEVASEVNKIDLKELYNEALKELIESM